jgi:Domain of unknown function (DUF1707)
MPEPGDERTAVAGGSGRLRASRADRERVIELLKVAFVQDRLTQDELDTRIGLALVSRTYADLADLTTDIPAELSAAEPVAEPVGSPMQTLAKAARRSAICILVPLAMAGVIALTNAGALLGPAFLCGIAAVVAASIIFGCGVLDAWEQRASRRRLPPMHRDGTGLEVEHLGGTVGDPAQPAARTDQNRVDLRARRSARGPRHPSGPGFRVRPIPAAV